MDDLLQINDLTIRYETADGVVRAVNGASLRLGRGRTLGLVGETGAGKTTIAKGIMRLIPSPPGVIGGGEILFEGRDLLKASDAEMRGIRGQEISMIFQDPMSALNPVMTVGDQIAEVIRSHSDISKEDSRKKAAEMMEMVGIKADRADEYPHQFSGGMKQRVVIAIALACNPKLLIADEPTTALDVTIQAQVLEMMKDLRDKSNTAMLLITHDLGVVAQVCDEVAIIYAGEIVEYGAIRDIFKNYHHPYTEGLFGSIPKLNEDVDRLSPIPGLMADPMNLPAGCSFCSRCKYATERCQTEKAGLTELGNGHYVKCFHAEQVAGKGGAAHG